MVIKEAMVVRASGSMVINDSITSGIWLGGGYMVFIGRMVIKDSIVFMVSTSGIMIINGSPVFIDSMVSSVNLVFTSGIWLCGGCRVVIKCSMVINDSLVRIDSMD